MKDTYKIWSRLWQRSYTAVNAAPNLSARKAARSDSFNSLDSETRCANCLDIKYKSTFTLGLIGLIAIAAGMLLMFIRPYDIIFKMKVLLSDGGEIFEMWRAPPVDLYLRVHLFNITNPEEFLRGDEKLKVQEVGPYVYREIMSHANVSFNENGTLSAVPQHPLEWVPELSIGDHEKDELMLVNIALLSIADVVSKKSFLTRGALNFVIKQTKTEPIVKMSPKEFMFGYKSTLMSLGYSFLPNWIDFEKLGLIDRMYNFKGDYETVYTGEKDISKAGLLDTYRGSTKLPQWEGYCGNVQNASDGTKFASVGDRNETLYFFRKSLCRAKPMVWANTTSASGLYGYVYKFAKNANDNGRYDEKNKCFCKKDKCFPPGLLDVNECYYGFPIGLSYPHFLDADPSLGAMVDGLLPDRRRHESYFVIQPESGLPLDLAVRYQINMVMNDVRNIENAGRFSNLVVPMLWTENRLYSLPEDLAARFRLYLNILPILETAFLYVFLVLGLIFVAMSLRQFAKTSRKFASNVRWLAEEEDATAERKLSVYIPETRRRMSDKELKMYFNSLTTPLNQQLEPVALEEHHIRHDGADTDEDL